MAETENLLSDEELDALSFAESMILNEECSLQEACDWLEYKEKK